LIFCVCFRLKQVWWIEKVKRMHPAQWQEADMISCYHIAFHLNALELQKEIASEALGPKMREERGGREKRGTSRHKFPAINFPPSPLLSITYSIWHLTSFDFRRGLPAQELYFCRHTVHSRRRMRHRPVYRSALLLGNEPKCNLILN
jgi:hypothetical protein